MKERARKERSARIGGRFFISTNSGDYAVTLTRPSKESNFRWNAEALNSGALGDTPEEACDNLRDLLNKRVSRGRSTQ